MELREKFRAAAADLQIVSMEQYLPQWEDQATLKNWFNLPDDRHPSETGNRVYAAALERALVASTAG